MKILLTLVLSLSIFNVLTAQKSVSELTVTYDITIQTESKNPNIINMFNGATTTIYLKQNSHRTDQVNGLGTTSTIYDGKNSSAVILKEYGKQKMLIKLTSKNWTDYNAKYNGIIFNATTETKEIAGYKCVKYNGKMTDGTIFTVYATTDIIPEAKDYNMQVKGVTGLIMQYEVTFGTGENKVVLTNTASKVTTANVPPAKFEIPKAGYREMTYEESIK